MNEAAPIPFELDTTIVARHKDIKLSKLRRLRDRPLGRGEEYVRKNELVRIEQTDVYNGRRIRVMKLERADVVKAYEPEPPNNWALKYMVKLTTLKIKQLRNLVRRLIERTTRLRIFLARPGLKLKAEQINILNFQFMRMAKQLEMAVAEAKGRVQA